MKNKNYEKIYVNLLLSKQAFKSYLKDNVFYVSYKDNNIEVAEDYLKLNEKSYEDVYTLLKDM